MNAAVGTVDPAFSSGGSGHSGKPTLSVDGPWLDNKHSHRRNSPWRTYGRTAEISSGFRSTPRPSRSDQAWGKYFEGALTHGKTLPKGERVFREPQL
jgi:hypothetical protein